MKPASLAALAAVSILLAGCAQLMPGNTGQPQTVTISGPDPAQASEARNSLRIRIPARAADALVERVAHNGDTETWMAVDNISVSYRQGVMVATRGLGADLMAGDAIATLTALRMPEDGVYSRQMRYLTGDHRSTWIQAGCEMKRAGTETRGSRSLTRYEESCTARRDRFTNLYWLDGSGQVVASRQWVSAAVGYLETTPTAK